MKTPRGGNGNLTPSCVCGLVAEPLPSKQMTPVRSRPGALVPFEGTFRKSALTKGDRLLAQATKRTKTVQEEHFWSDGSVRSYPEPEKKA